MLKRNKSCLFLYLIYFICNLQNLKGDGERLLIAPDFKTDWQQIRAELENFERNESTLLGGFQMIALDYTKFTLSVFAEDDIFEEAKICLTAISTSFLKIDNLIDKILKENLTTSEIYEFTFFELPKIKERLNRVFEEAYRIFYLTPCYKTFCLLKENINLSQAQILEAYEYYQFKDINLNIYKNTEKKRYVCTNLSFKESALLGKPNKKYKYIKTVCISKDAMHTYDVLFEVFNEKNTDNENLTKKIKECLEYKSHDGNNYIPIPKDTNLWHLVFPNIIGFLKEKNQHDEKLFITCLEEFLCHIYLITAKPIQHIKEDFKIKIDSEKEYEFHEDEAPISLFPIVSQRNDIPTNFSKEFSKYIKEQGLFNSDNLIHLLITIMRASDHYKIRSRGKVYQLRCHENPDNNTSLFRFVCMPTKFKRCFSQDF